MATRLLYEMNYQSDLPFGGNGSGLYNAFPFDIAQGFQDCTPAGVIERADRPCQCIPPGLFSPRALVGKFAVELAGVNKCVNFKVPLPNIAGITAAVQTMKDCGALCVDLEGERWNRLPPSLAGYVPSPNIIYQIPSAKTANVKVTGTTIYTSDALGAGQSLNVRYQAEPLALTGATLANGAATAGADFAACHGILQAAIPCGDPGSVSARRLIIVSRQQAGADAPVRALSKEVVLASAADIASCITSLGAKSICLQYRGESIRYVDVLLGI